ncbi:MAG: endonuclease/exonuclease/phosphatase family protein [Bacilli bacterium]
MIINFMTFNIQHCKNYMTKEIDIDIMVKTIKDCHGDIIGLNEVFGASETEPSQAEMIAKALGYHYYFGQAILYHGRPYGNAIISKYPITKVETIMIPDPIKNDIEFFESRCFIKALFHSLNFTLFTSHFGLAKGEKINAVNTLLLLMKNETNPLVFMGDLNMEPNDAILQPLFSHLVNTLPSNEPTFPSINPNKKIDYIFVSKEIDVLKATIPNIVASDHFPLLAMLKIK